MSSNTLLTSSIQSGNHPIDEIIHLYESKGKELFYEESLSQLEHALQCAEATREITDEPDLIVSALLHDIGHLLESKESGELGNIDHHLIGAEYLESRGFPYRVNHIIANHVNAKRYLVTTQPEYTGSLSGASLKTLEMQGGPMTAEEANSFENDPFFDDILLIRICDEQAKSAIPAKNSIAHYRSLLESVVSHPTE